MMLRKFFWFLSVVLCFGLVNVSAQTQVPKIISGGVINGKATSLPKPEYPPAAAAVGAKGAVNVEVVIDEQGNVESATAVSGHPLLRAAAVEAARQAEFALTQLSGQPVKVKGVVIYNFNLSNEDKGGLTGSAENDGPVRTTGRAFKVDPNKSIGDGVVNGKAISLPKPAYPAAARAVKAGGAVNVQVKIDEQGNVESATAVSGHPLLRAAAVAAAREAKFKPTLLSGEPVSITGIIVYNFVPSPDVKSNEDSGKTISGGILNGKATSLSKPSYPLEAKDKGASGAVTVSVKIDEQGNVISAKATSGDPIFYETCEKAALDSKFSPTLLEGNPVMVTGSIIYNFVP